MKIKAFSSQALLALSGIVIGGSLICETAFAQAPRTLYLYSAAPGSGRAFQTGAKTGPWGNGTIRRTRQNIDYEGASVMEVETKNFAEGIRFDLNEPLDLTPYQDQGFIRLRLRFKNSTAFNGAVPGGEGFPGGGFPGGGFPGGGFPGGGFPGGGFPGGGFPGGAAFPGGGVSVPSEADLLKPRWNSNAQFGPRPGGALPPFGGPGFGAPGEVPVDGATGLPIGPPPQETSITALKITLIRETGAMMGRIPIDLEESQPDSNGWRLFLLAVRDLTATKDAAGPVQRVLLTSDNEDKFFLAQAALVVETGKMTVSIRRAQDPAGTQTGEIEVKPGPVNLVADLEAGTADPNIEWNFDADKVGNLAPPAVNGGAVPGVNPEGGNPFGQPGFPGNPGGIPGAEGGANPAFAGPRIDARGLAAAFEYPNEEQNYRVEVTVRDKNGKKEPVTASILVKVRG